MSCGVGRRCSSDMALLWLWGRQAAAALTQPLAWELPYAVGTALKKKKRKKSKRALLSQAALHSTNHGFHQLQDYPILYKGLSIHGF